MRYVWATIAIVLALAFVVHATVFEPPAGSGASAPAFIQASATLPVSFPTPVRVVPNNPVDSSCKTVTVNAQGVANAGIAVTNTAGGVSIMAASTSRCSALIENGGTTNTMFCGPTTITVSATVGYLIEPQAFISLGLEAQQAWKCFSTGGTTAYVAEGTT